MSTSLIETPATLFSLASIVSNWLVIARLSLVPLNQILLREILNRLANWPMNRLVSQLFNVTLATVKRPLPCSAGGEPISSTRKSSALVFSKPPMPSPSQE